MSRIIHTSILRSERVKDATLDHFDQAFFDAVGDIWGCVPRGAKGLARAALCSVRSAENYLQRKRVAQAQQLMNMMANSPEFCDRMLALLPGGGRR